MRKQICILKMPVTLKGWDFNKIALGILYWPRKNNLQLLYFSQYAKRRKKFFN
jgi:hypothetical protein